MLSSLQIKNFVLISKLSLDFSKGFNVLTGETGAGKSLIASSLDLLLGKRASTDLIRKGSNEAQVEAIFEIGDESEVLQRLKDSGFEADNELLIKRIISRDGKNKCYINGQLASISVLQQLTVGLASIMSQHQQHTLFETSKQLELLDGFANNTTTLLEMAAAYKSMKEHQDKIDHLKKIEHERASRIDYLRFQLEELESLNPANGEYSDLETRLIKTKHQTNLLETTVNCANELYESDGSIFERMGQISRSISDLVHYDSSLSQATSSLEEATILIEEIARTIGDYSRSLETEPANIDDLNSRLETLFRLSKKHGTNPDELPKVIDSFKQELETLEEYEQSLNSLEKTNTELMDKAKEAAKKLSTSRNEHSKKLEQLIARELKDLAFEKAKFKINVVSVCANLTPRGVDQIDFQVEFNQGEGFFSLRKVASGGELSRIMLAIKRALSGVGPVGTYIFDEIDAGIGGNVANSVAKKLFQVSRHHQLLCITHLPQIASIAGTHFHISKAQSDGRTETSVSKLTEKQKVLEIARMLGGDSSNKKMIAAAKELLLLNSE